MNRFFTAAELFGEEPGSKTIKKFFDLQLRQWQFARESYGNIKNFMVKIFHYDDTSVSVQFNPERARSTFAVIDTEAIKGRKCFLCDENLYPEQIGLRLTENYTLLVNPFPILPEHFTAKFNVHVPQKIEPVFKEFLQIINYCGENYFALYNGPKCGASVPEHRHFQMGIKNALPLISEIIDRTKEAGLYKPFLYSDELRNFFIIYGDKENELEKVFFNLFEKLSKHFPDEPEPKINLLGFKNKELTCVAVIPRKAHRPKSYYQQGRIKVSPATIDIGGVLVVPEENDFEAIAGDEVKKIFSEVLFGKYDLKKVLA